MRIPTYAEAFQVLLLQAADEGRGDALFGESLQRARDAVPPFLVGDRFPSVYLEHPLVGAPFLDVTVLLGKLQSGVRIGSPAAGDHAAMLDWYADACREMPDVCCGFELDTEEEVLPTAAVHFQPRAHTELVRPFCEAAGDPSRAELYLDIASRMPESWQLAFFGMFRGRPSSPLRICGYVGDQEKHACAQDPSRLREVFGTVGFTAYDDAMLSQVSTLMAAAPGGIDFQFDVYPDKSLGSTFSMDVQFEINQPKAMRAAFDDGPAAPVMRQLEAWGIADGRWKSAVASAFARALPVELEDGGIGSFGLVLMPQWVKARWRDTALQPSKLYHLMRARLYGTDERGA